MKKEDEFKISIDTEKITDITDKGKQNLNEGIKILMQYKEVKKKKLKQRLKENKNSKNKGIINLLVVILLIIIVVLVVIFIKFSPVLGINLYSRDVNNSIIENIDYESSYIGEYNEEILVVTNNKINTFNINGEETWEYEINNIYNPNVYINGNYMIICDIQDSTVYIFNEKKEISSKKIEGTIIDIYLDEYGNYIVEHSTTSYNKKISLYNKNSQIKEEIYLENESIIDIKILNNAKELILLTTNISSLNIGTNISYINLEDKEASVSVIYTLEDEIIVSCVSLNNDLIIQTNNNVISFNLENKNITEIYNYSNQNTINIKLEWNYFALIAEDTNGYYVQNLNYEGIEISKNKVESLPKYIAVNKYIVALVSENYIEIQNKWGTILKKAEIDFLPREVVIFNNSTGIALIYGNTIEIIKL